MAADAYDKARPKVEQTAREIREAVREASPLDDPGEFTRRVKDRLRSRYNISVAETSEHADLWQRGGLTVVAVAHRRDALVRLFEAIYRDAENGTPGTIVERDPEFIEAADSMDAWLEDEA